jgi:hypothetical protein
LLRPPARQDGFPLVGFAFATPLAVRGPSTSRLAALTADKPQKRGGIEKAAMRLRKRDRIVPNKVCAQSGAADTRNRLGRLTDLLLPCGSGAMV